MRGQHPERTWTSLRMGRGSEGLLSVGYIPAAGQSIQHGRAEGRVPANYLIEAGERGWLVGSSQSAVDEKMGAELGTLEGHLL